DVADGDAVAVGTMAFTFSRTDHGPETLGMRVDAGGRSLGYSADTGPAWSLEALGPGLDLALCEATLPADPEGPLQHLSPRVAAGSVLVSMGRTRVLCTASVDERVPPWMRGRGTGWVTAEYSMLPGSTPDRSDREVNKGKPSGRTQEIQRLIGRSLRSVTDMKLLGERQVVVDCDALQADGGTRTASICGAYVALHDALTRLQKQGAIQGHPL